MNKKKVVTLCILSSLVVILTILIKLNQTNYLDYKIFNIIHNINKGDFTNFFIIISDYGIVLGVIVTLIVIFLKIPKFAMIESGLNILLIALLNFIIKISFQRIRPDWRIIPITGYSYPSAHTMISTVVYGYFIYLTNHYINNRYLKFTIYSLSIIMMLLIGFSRIYLGVHYASDVLAGYLISFIFLIIITSLNKTIKTKENNNLGKKA